MYYLYSAEEEGDLREEEDPMPLNVFTLASNISIPSDEEVLRLSSDSSDVQQTNASPKPIILVDVTEAVKQKVENLKPIFL